MKYSIIIIVLVICSCSPSLKEEIDSNKILGKWCSKSYDKYLSLTFKRNGGAVFDSKYDTVYYFSYALDRNYLSLNGSASRNRILKLTQDSLILETLLEFNTIQAYHRCK